jgi:hypothetical protein
LRKRLTKQGSVGNRSRKTQTNEQDQKECRVPIMLDREEIAAMLQDCLTDFATEVGLKVACLLFEKQADTSRTNTTSERNRSDRHPAASPKKRRTQPRKQRS